jgi:hypothetical protein
MMIESIIMDTSIKNDILLTLRANIVITVVIDLSVNIDLLLEKMQLHV